jgi:Flp pilus assembly protein TadG
VVGRPARAGQGDRGAAVVEFTLVGVLLTALFLVLLQLGLARHVRNTLLASAAEGARYAANADRSRDQGEAVTRRLIRDSLADSLARHVTSGVETVDGASTVYVQVEATLPVIAFFGPPRAIRVRGHALEEGT